MVGVKPVRTADRVRLPHVSLPPEAPLGMPVQDLRRTPEPMIRRTTGKGPSWARIAVFAGAAVLTVIFVREMYGVLSVARMTPIETIMLGLFAISIAWICFAFASAVAGFLALLFARGRLSLPEAAGRVPSARTAILIPAYNEDPARVFAAAAATGEALAAAGAAQVFDIFVLSDTTNPDVWVAEEMAYRALQARPGPRSRVFYRRRHRNVERKAGNVADWCRRFGRAYPFFVVLDADSLMEADTLIRLGLAIEARPDVALIQTVPAVVNRNTLFARVQQFAGRVYGPVMSAGLAVWAGNEGNYWGHNAIIRTQAFTGSAGLPHLSGRPPLGGHILSHDFVEAALMRRAGWSIVLAPLMGGSYEESPPSLIDLATRDRRWCQGNLQHSKVLFARGLAWPSRMHLLTGIMSYVASPIWLMFLIAGLLLALQARFIRPEYFTEEFQLFPTWPVIDSERAIGLFVATMTILFLPKLLALIVALGDRQVRRGIGGPVLGTVSVLIESLIAALLAPVMMAIQSAAVLDILVGRDSGWNPQRRDDGTVPLSAIARRHRDHVLLGLVLGGSAWAVSPQVFAWLSPAIAGLLLAITMSWLTARLDVGLALRRAGLLRIPEEDEQPTIIRRAGEITAELETKLAGPAEACARLTADPGLLAFHRANIGHVDPLPRGDVDVALAVGMGRLEAASTMAEAVSFLSPREKLAVLANPDGLDRIASLPHGAFKKDASAGA